jgi:hypothetical protein
MIERQMLAKTDHELRCPPCFDDERTITTARQVVPLQHLAPNLKHRRILFLVGAYALAMVLGTVSGLVSAYFETGDVLVSQVIQENPTTSAVSVEDTASPVSEESFNKDNIDDLALALAPIEEPGPKLVATKRVRSKPASFIIDSTHSSGLPLSEKEELQRIREEVLINGSKKPIRAAQRH